MILKDFTTLAAAQAHTEINGKKLSADLMRAFLNDPTVQLYDYFKSATHSATQFDYFGSSFNIGDLKMTVYDNLTSAGEFNFITGHPSDQTTLMNVIIAAETNIAINQQLVNLKNICLAYCNSVSYPFLNATQLQFNYAKGIYTEKEVIGYTQGQNVKVTLIDTLPENCAATTWAKDTIFDYENIGKLAHLKVGTSVYKLKMDNLKVDGKLFVRVPFELFNYTVEAI